MFELRLSGGVKEEILNPETEEGVDLPSPMKKSEGEEI